MDEIFDVLIDVMNSNEFMINHEKDKVKDINKAIKKLIKVNENTENKIDLEPYFKERDVHLKNLTGCKQFHKKLNKIYKILMND